MPLALLAIQDSSWTEVEGSFWSSKAMQAEELFGQASVDPFDNAVWNNRPSSPPPSTHISMTPSPFPASLPESSPPLPFPLPPSPPSHHSHAKTSTTDMVSERSRVYLPPLGAHFGRFSSDATQIRVLRFLNIIFGAALVGVVFLGILSVLVAAKS